MQQETAVEITSVRTKLVTRISLASVGLRLLEVSARTPEEAEQAVAYTRELQELLDKVSHATDLAQLDSCETSFREILAKTKQL